MVNPTFVQLLCVLKMILQDTVLSQTKAVFLHLRVLLLMSLVTFTIAITRNTPPALETNSTSISGLNEQVVLSVLVSTRE